jgi:hypothetical protein
MAWSFFQRVVEEKILEAERTGAFDHLPGKGRPLKNDSPRSSHAPLVFDRHDSPLQRQTRREVFPPLNARTQPIPVQFDILFGSAISSPPGRDAC